MLQKLINSREAYGFWLNELGLTGEAAEIGCLRGEFARTVLSQWRGKRYHMVDPWATQDKEVYRENQEEQEAYEKFYEGVLQLAVEDNRVNVVRLLSVDAAAEFKDGQLDSVYIDGNHSYASVMADMDAWWTKVRIGGILGGHDFENNTEGGNWIEVEKAVIRWTKEHGKVFYVSPCGSWWIHKTSP